MLAFECRLTFVDRGVNQFAEVLCVPITTVPTVDTSVGPSLSLLDEGAAFSEALVGFTHEKGLALIRG